LGVADPASAAALPFELRVLEVALDSVARHFAVAAHAVEAAAGPCLRMPTATKLTTDFLQRLRGVKQRAAVTRIKLETVRDVLERLLDDRQAMVALHLTAVEAAEAEREAAAAEDGGTPMASRGPWAGLSAAAARLVRRSGGPLFSRLGGPGGLFGRQSASGSGGCGGGGGGGPGRHSFSGASPAAALAAALERASTGSAAAAAAAGLDGPSAAVAAAAAAAALSLAAALDRRSTGAGGGVPGVKAKALASYLARASGGSDGDGGGGAGSATDGLSSANATTAGDGLASTDDPATGGLDPEECVEMLLETYLAALDAAHARLEALDEHVEGVEDLLDIELDAFRNNNIKVRLVINACGLVAFIVFAITGFLAMNLAQRWRGLEAEGAGGRREWPPGSALMFVLVGAGSAGGSLVVLAAWLIYLNQRGLGLASITALTRAD